jgi:hypothetical protein
LPMRVERGELVGDNVHCLVKSGRHAARLRPIDLNRNMHLTSLIPARRYFACLNPSRIRAFGNEPSRFP